jgi:NADH-quinone oxidoreductase subunit J
VALLAGLQVIASRSPIHSAIGLVTSFLAIAGLYVLLHAEFVAAVQVLVYAGGIMVLFLFVILLVNLRERSVRRPRPRTILQAATGLLAIGAMLVVVRRGHWADVQPGAVTDAGGGNLEAVGAALFTDALLPFEIASLLLLVAMVAAIVLARDLRREEG